MKKYIALFLIGSSSFASETIGFVTRISVDSASNVSFQTSTGNTYSICDGFGFEGYAGRTARIQLLTNLLQLSFSSRSPITAAFDKKCIVAAAIDAK